MPIAAGVLRALKLKSWAAHVAAAWRLLGTSRTALVGAVDSRTGGTRWEISGIRSRPARTAASPGPTTSTIGSP